MADPDPPETYEVRLTAARQHDEAMRMMALQFGLRLALADTQVRRGIVMADEYAAKAARWAYSQATGRDWDEFA